MHRPPYHTAKQTLCWAREVITIQETIQIKKVLAALALATLAASPAFAATSHKQRTSASASYAAAHDPNVVVSDGQIVGRDPDPNIRFQLMRDPGLPAN